MATKVYVVREKEVNGKIVKEYYNKESDVALKLKVNEDQPYVVYDDEKKVQLKGKELDAYIESHQDEFEEKEEVIDDNKSVNKLSVEIKDADNKYSYIFSNDDIVTRTLVAITIHEGRNRQVRRMFEHFGYEVKNLHRESIGFLNLNGVERGMYRKLTNMEVAQIKDLCKKNKANNVIPDYKRK